MVERSKIAVRHKAILKILCCFLIIVVLAASMFYLIFKFANSIENTSFEEIVVTNCKPNKVYNNVYEIDQRLLPLKLETGLLDIQYSGDKKYKLVCFKQDQRVLLKTKKSTYTGISIGKNLPAPLCPEFQEQGAFELNYQNISLSISVHNDLAKKGFITLRERSDHPQEYRNEPFIVTVKAYRVFTLWSGETIYISMGEILMGPHNERLTKTIEEIKGGLLLKPVKTEHEFGDIYLTFRMQDINEEIRKRFFNNIENLQGEEKEKVELIHSLLNGTSPISLPAYAARQWFRL